MQYIYRNMHHGLKHTLLSAAWMLLLLLSGPSMVAQNLQLSFTAVPPTCAGYTNGTVTVTATGGTAPYGYLWNNGQMGQTNLGVGAGTVSVTVTDNAGVTANGSFTVTEPPQIVAAVTPTGFDCNTVNGTLNASATGGTGAYTYVWTGGSIASTLPVTSAGAYILTATDANGCSDLASYFVNPPLAVDVEVENIPCFMFCDGVARAVVSGGAYPYMYQWNTGATTQQISALPPGWYIVTVTDAAGCIKVDSAYIYEPPAITISFTTVVPACGGNTGSVTAQANGGTPPFTYLWNYNNITGPVLSNVPAGTYFVQVKDANGCQKDSSVVIPAGMGLNVSLSIQKASCQGVNDGIATAVVTPATGNYSYHWNIQNVNSPTINGIAAGTNVCVTVTDITSGCQGTACAVVGTHTIIGLQVTDTDVSCLGDSTGTATALASNGTAPYNYVWTTQGDSIANTAMITGLAAGAYSVQVTDDQGCTAVGVADIGVLSKLEAAYQISVVKCEGDSIQIRLIDKSTDSSSTIVAWEWNVISGSTVLHFTQQNPPVLTFAANETGTVQLTVTSAAGCKDFVSGPFDLDSLPNIYLDVDSVAFNCDGSPIHIHVTGDPNYMYTWFPSVTYVTGPLDVIANPPQTQLYTLVAGNGSCIDTVQVLVIRQTPLLLSVAQHAINTCTSTAMLTALTNVNATVQWFDQNDSLIGGNNITVPATQMPKLYRVIARDALGCTQMDSVVVTGQEVSIALSVPNEVVDCDNAPIAINVTGAPAYTYMWSPAGLIPNPNFPPGSPNVIANPMVTTTYQLIATNGFCADTASVKVVRVKPINLQIQDTVVVACTPNKQLAVTINAASNATVTWYPTNETGLSIMVPVSATPTTYIAIATDTLYHQCVDSVDVTVSGHPVEVEVMATTPLPACEHQPVSFTAVNGHPEDVLTYTWSSNPPMEIVPNGQSTVTVTGVSTSSYEIILIATNTLYGCMDTATAPVSFLPVGSLDGQIKIQNCDGLTVTFQNLSNVPGIWNFGDSTTSSLHNTMHTYADSGTYTATFIPTNADCTPPFDTVLAVQADPAVVASITSNLLDCSAVAVYQLNGQPTGNNYTFSWNVDGQFSTDPNPVFTFNQTGTITAQLTVTNNAGCSDVASIPLDVQFITDKAANDTTVCFGNAVQLNPTFNPAYTYLWTASPFDSTLVTTSPNPIVTPNDFTTYIVQISNGTDCIVLDTVKVSAQDNAILNAGPDQNVCGDALVTLSVQNPMGNNYQWSQSPDFNPIIAEGNTIQVVPEKNGVYYVRSEADGCTSKGSVRVNNAEVNIDALPLNRNLCLGDSTQLLISNLDLDDHLTYTWSPIDSTTFNPTVRPDSTATYSVTITNQYGCKDTVAFQVNVAAVAVTAEVTGKDTICPGQSTTLLATATGTGTTFVYSWEPANSLTGANTANPTARPDEETIYTVTATTADGLCPQSASVPIYFMGDQCVEPYVFVPNAFSPNSDQHNDHFLVRGNNIKELYLVVWDRWGEKVFETEDAQTTGWDGTYLGKSLTPDAYAWYVKVTCGNGAVYSKKGNVTLLK